MLSWGDHQEVETNRQITTRVVKDLTVIEKKPTQSNNLFNYIQNPRINADSRTNDNASNSASEYSSASQRNASNSTTQSTPTNDNVSNSASEHSSANQRNVHNSTTQCTRTNQNNNNNNASSTNSVLIHAERRRVEVENKKKDALIQLKKISTMHRNHANSIEDDDNILVDDVQENSGVENNDDAECTSNTTGKYKCQPSKQSSLHQYLENKKDNMLKLLSQTKPSCQQWFPPSDDPLTFYSEDPDDWYLSDVWCFSWLPIQQYSKCGLSIRSFWTCSKCRYKCTIQEKGYRWRPALHLDRITWVLYRRYEFKCGYTINSIDDAFLSQLLIKIRERFLLIFGGSMGIHESLI